MTDTQLERLCEQAQSSATRDQEPKAVFNLNKVGKRLLVVRPADSFPGEDRMVAGPFQPAGD